MQLKELKEGWLKCDISDGMFSNEKAIKCNSATSDIFSFFVHHSLVDEKRTAVRVSIIDCQGKYCTIYLPVEPVEGISRTVLVSQEDILR